MANEEELMKQKLAEIQGLRDGINDLRTTMHNGFDSIEKGLDGIHADLKAMHESRSQRRQEMINELRASNNRL